MTRFLLTGKHNTSYSRAGSPTKAHKQHTGGSGFIAAHVLDVLLERGHSVVTTVRSLQKAQAIKDAHPTFSKDKLDFAIVEDIATEHGIGEIPLVSIKLNASDFPPKHSTKRLFRTLPSKP